MAALQQAHFRFTELPAELRLTIYEFLPIQTKHVVVDNETDADSAVTTLLIQQVPVQLLRVCRLVHNEAKGILALKLRSVREATPKIIMDAGVKGALLERKDGILTHTVAWFRALRESERADFREWTAKESSRRASPAQLSRSTLYFVQQAGIQMLHQWRTRVFVDTQHSDGTTTASVMVAIRVTGRQGPSTEPILYGQGSSHFTQTRISHRLKPTKAPCTRMIIDWTTPITKDESDIRGKTKEDLFKELFLNKDWDAGDRLF
tara:strand:- start:1905 stop:2693 length:789 start_codon:yes stop_codon:yes gene_type:complete